jgi:hypothetical protein
MAPIEAALAASVLSARNRIPYQSEAQGCIGGIAEWGW